VIQLAVDTDRQKHSEVARFSLLAINYEIDMLYVVPLIAMKMTVSWVLVGFCIVFC